MSSCHLRDPSSPALEAAADPTVPEGAGSVTQEPTGETQNNSELVSPEAVADLQWDSEDSEAGPRRWGTWWAVWEKRFGTGQGFLGEEQQVGQERAASHCRKKQCRPSGGAQALQRPSKGLGHLGQLHGNRQASRTRGGHAQQAFVSRRDIVPGGHCDAAAPRPEPWG